MKKLSYLIKYGLMKRLKSKAFLVANVVVGLIILAITMLPGIISSVTGGRGERLDDPILIVNTSSYNGGDADMAMYLRNFTYYNLIALPNNYEVRDRFTLSTDLDDVPDVSFYENESEYVGIVYIYEEKIDPSLPGDNVDNLIIKVQIYDKGMKPVVLQMLTAGIKDIQRIKYSIDHPTFNDDLVKDLIPEFVADPNNVGGISDELLAGIAPIIIVPIFILITFAFQAIGAEIIEEKSTKAIEIIIASVKPRTHFIAKILAIMIFQLIQLTLYALYGVIGVMINEIIAGGAADASWGAISASLDINFVPVIIVMLFCALLGATLYAVFGAFIGSLSINQEDYQQTQTPVMLILMIGYMGSIFAGAFGSKELILIFAYIPFFTPMVLPVTLAMGYITLLEAVIGLVIIVATIAIVMTLISPLYRASILSYDQSNLFKRIKNTIKQAKALKENQKLYEENTLE